MAGTISGGQECSNGCQHKPITLGEHLDNRIACCRKNLEEACILKARAEAVNMLDKPMNFINQLVGYPY